MPKPHTVLFRLRPAAVALAACLAASPAPLVHADVAPAAVDAAAYDRLLPLAGGSNFRDLGGYFTEDGRQVRRGLLFRSGVMTSLTAADQAYLAGFGFERVVDLRSSEERDLYPNHWAAAQEIEIIADDYSMAALIQRMVDEGGAPQPMHALYENLPQRLQPQLRALFAALIDGQAPLVMNCSAGQDRTGVAAALVLLALGVPEDVVIQDYLVSTRYRRPDIERGDVDLATAAEDNAFARIMLQYAGEDGEARPASPLLTERGVPFLRFALERIELEYGSLAVYLDEALGVDAADLAVLRERYLVATYLAP